MSQAVVNLLEGVHIEVENKKCIASTVCEPEGLFGKDVKSPAIVELGQLVTEREFTVGTFELLATAG